MANRITSFVLLFLLWTTTAMALNESTKPPEINIYLDNNPPFSSFNSQKQAKGLYVDYWKEWSSTSGIAIKFFPTLKKDIQKSLINNTPSLYSGMNIRYLSLKNMHFIKSKLVNIVPHYYYFLSKAAYLNKQLIDKNQPLVVGGLLPEAQKLPEFANNNHLVYKKFPGLLEALISLYRNKIDALVLFTAQDQTNQWIDIFLSNFLSSSSSTSSNNSLFYYTTQKQHILIDWIAWGKQDLAKDALMASLKNYRAPYLGVSIKMARNIGIIVFLLLVFIWLCNAKRKKDKQFITILNSAPYPLIILSTDGHHISYLNDAVKILFAFKFINKRAYFDIEKNQTLISSFVSGLRHQSIIQTSVIKLIVDNTCHEIEISTKRIHYNGKSAWLCYLNDITAQLMAENKLLEECYLLRTVLDSIPEQIAYKSLEGEVIGCNNAWAVAHNSSVETATGKLFSSFFSDEENQIQVTQDKTVWAGHTFSAQQWNKKEKDKTRLIQVTKVPLHDDQAGILGILSIDSDITDLLDLISQLPNEDEQRLQTQRALRGQNALLKTLFKITVDPMVLLDENDNIIDANNSFLNLLDHENLDLARKYLCNFNGKESHWIFLHNKALLSSDQPMIFKVLIKHKNIETSYEIRKVAFKDAISRFQGIVVMAKNISSLQKPKTDPIINVRNIAPAELIDNLTNIPNRRSFDLRFDELWLQVKAQDEMITLVLCELDDFKSFNVKHGPEKGDLVLRLFAQALKSMADKVDCFVARYNGSKFIFIFKGGNATKALKTTEKMFAASHEVLCDAYEIRLNMGLSSMFPSNLNNKKMLVAEAELAMKDAKSSGMDKIGVY